MNITLEMLMNAWLPIIVFYLVWCWGLPMLGLLSNPYAQESRANYWQATRWIVLTMHISTIAAFVLFWYLEPYMFPTQ